MNSLLRLKYLSGSLPHFFSQITPSQVFWTHHFTRMRLSQPSFLFVNPFSNCIGPVTICLSVLPVFGLCITNAFLSSSSILCTLVFLARFSTMDWCFDTERYWHQEPAMRVVRVFIMNSNSLILLLLVFHHIRLIASIYF